MIAKRGMRDKIEKCVDPDNTIVVNMAGTGNSSLDYCCFGVDANGKLSDDRYMVFYNQLSSPAREIVLAPGAGGGAKFLVSLSQLPPDIDKLVFTANIDGNGTMGNMEAFTATISQGEEPALELHLSGRDFHKEKAIIALELYRKSGWRFAVVAAGFNGGLGDLLRSYGGEEMTQASDPEPPPTPQKIPQREETAPPSVPEPSLSPQKTPQREEMALSSVPEPPLSPQKISLKKGQKISLMKNAGKPIIVENGWSAKNKDYDLKALVRYRDRRLVYVGAANADEVLSTPEGAVRHGGDIRHPGELERLTISWDPSIASVAVSSYSALENGAGSFRKYGVFVRITNGSQIIEIPAASTSAKRTSYTLCFGEILFGPEKDALEVSALEMYSRPRSEARIGYRGDKVVMDIGPTGRRK